jgi:TonB family protein
MELSAAPQGPFSMLPEMRKPWTGFVCSMGTEAVAIAILLWIPVLHPQLLDPPRRQNAIALVPTPAPVNHQPQPIRIVQKPVLLAHLDPPPEALRLPAPIPKPKAIADAPVPEVRIPAKKLDPLPAAGPVIPKQLVRTNVFSTGSSATPTIAKAPDKVQTGGFGDPNGVPAKEGKGKAINIGALGSFDLPSGPGYGNGTGGANGARGVVASAGFGNGVAIADNSGRASRGPVQQAGFQSADVPAPPTAHARPVEAAIKLVPAEILSKPLPIYTEEARKLKVEGEVLLEVVLESSGRLRVVKVVRGLGHGLDDAAVRAAEQIRFKPALQDGQPADSTAVLHIIFQIA